MNNGILYSAGGIILKLMISDKPDFIPPVCGIRQSLIIEFIGPDQFPIGILALTAGSQYQ
jgi:hypothetical protein